jgi:hypothetical protein
MEAKRDAERHAAFFDLERDPQRAALTQPNTLLRTTEWGGLTLVSLLAYWAFPPYFVAVMLLASLNAGGMLWVSHLTEAGRQRLREFEAEFSKGHALEESGKMADAVAYYEGLAPHYQDHPNIAQIALRRADYLRKNHPLAFVKKAKSPAKAGKAKSKSKPPRKRRAA